jgi:quercetin dioxygenase-like cupin family protein
MDPVALPPGEGEQLGNHRVLAELPEYEAIVLSYDTDFEGVDPHTHDDHVDSFFVLEGEVEFFLEGEWRRYGPGGFVAVPRNVVHGFRPATRMRVLNVHAPNVGFISRLRERYQAPR